LISTRLYYWVWSPFVSSQDGRGVHSKEYLNWIEQAKKGDAEKSYLSGFAFYHGIGGAKRDYKKAFKWFKIAAKGGSSAATTNIGDMYSLGHFVAKDEQKAFQWYLQAAKAGSSEGMEKLADIYVGGELFEKIILKLQDGIKSRLKIAVFQVPL